MSHFLFIHSSIDGPLGCFHLSVNIGVQVFVHIFLFLLCIYLGMELLGHMITLYLTFSAIAKLFSKGITHVKFPSVIYKDFNFSISW